MTSEDIARLWDEVTPKLFGYLVNTLRDKVLAEDILQSTWAKAIAALPRYQDRGKPIHAWLFAIARNECKLHWRKANRESPLDPQSHDIPDFSSPDHTVLAEQILAGLPEDDRELLRLRYIADLPIADIANVLNINFVAVRVRLHRALKRARHANA